LARYLFEQNHIALKLLPQIWRPTWSGCGFQNLPDIITTASNKATKTSSLKNISISLNQTLDTCRQPAGKRIGGNPALVAKSPL